MTRKWIGFSEALAERREKRFQNNTPQPWVVRKLTIGFVVALVAWAWYVYIGRFCVLLIRGDVGVSGALGGKGLGIAFLAVFCFLGLMFWWSYIKVITTSPGYARDHVQKSIPPTPTWRPPHNQPTSPNWDLDSGLGMPYESMPPPALSVMPTPPPPSMFNTWGSNEHRDAGMGYPPTPLSNISQQQKYEAGYNNHSTSRSRSPEHIGEKRYDMGREEGVGSGRLEETETMGGTETGAVNGMNGLGEKMLPPSPTTTKRDSASTFLSNPKLSPLPPPSPSNTRRESQSRSQSQSRRQGQGRAHDSNQSRHGHDPERKHSSKPSTKSKSKPESHSRSHSRPHHSDRKPQPKPQPLASLGLGPAIPERQPSQKPVLAAEYRYCARDEHLKPMRTHHCRICGTCVLKYDHHCPWIGQCVGAFNHKFFLNFAQWSTLWTGWIFGTLVAQNAHVSMNGGDVDVQELIIIALSGLFTIFTFTLSIAHALLILKNETTVEALMAREQKEDEDAMLQARFGVCRFRTKRRVRKAWDLEWGKVKTEGNLWWLGSGRRNWEATMGRRVWTWFLPIGGPEGDGMVFARNPRFDEQGRLMRREMWPKELQ